MKSYSKETDERAKIPNHRARELELLTSLPVDDTKEYFGKADLRVEFNEAIL